MTSNDITVLLVGATGATGRLLVQQLLDRGHRVKVIVRSPDRLPHDLRDHASLSIVHADLLRLSDGEMQEHVTGCSAVASCLGHPMSLRGFYGAPQRLVTDASRRLCKAVRAIQPPRPVRFVLMNTAGNRGREERVSLGQRIVVGLVRLLLPPHADNEQAAAYLHDQGQGDAVEWVAVRPDSLVDGPDVSAYEVHPSPTRSAIFNAGKTSRINVAHFMAELMVDDATWDQWKGQMPVIYNQGYS